MRLFPIIIKVVYIFFSKMSLHVFCLFWIKVFGGFFLLLNFEVFLINLFFIGG